MALASAGRLRLGVEIGGTKLQAALGVGDGRLVDVVKRRVEPTAGREGICQALAAMIPELCGRQGVAVDSALATGVGFGGPVDAARGLVQTSHQIAGWDAFPLAEWFRETLGLTIRLGNDSDLAGLAEATVGAGRGFSPVVYMNVGSGIGGAIVVAGRLFDGQGMGAAEIGHQRMTPVDPADPAGRWHTLEDLASGWSLARAAREAASENPISLLATAVAGDLSQVTGETLAAAVAAGDPAAVEVWNRAVNWLGVALANVTTLLSPQLLVVGGGVAETGDLLMNPLRAAVARHVFKPFAHTYRIVPAALGQDVVLHGALTMAGS
ncbi:MAG: ROK family protein [Planctomycetia bacterium]